MRGVRCVLPSRLAQLVYAVTVSDQPIDGQPDFRVVVDSASLETPGP